MKESRRGTLAIKPAGIPAIWPCAVAVRCHLSLEDGCSFSSSLQFACLQLLESVTTRRGRISRDDPHRCDVAGGGPMHTL